MTFQTIFLFLMTMEIWKATTYYTEFHSKENQCMAKLSVVISLIVNQFRLWKACLKNVF